MSYEMDLALPVLKEPVDQMREGLKAGGFQSEATAPHPVQAFQATVRLCRRRRRKRRSRKRACDEGGLGHGGSGFALVWVCLPLVCVDDDAALLPRAMCRLQSPASLAFPSPIPTTKMYACIPSLFLQRQIVNRCPPGDRFSLSSLQRSIIYAPYLLTLPPSLPPSHS